LRRGVSATDLPAVLAAARELQFGRGSMALGRDGNRRARGADTRDSQQGRQ